MFSLFKNFHFQFFDMQCQFVYLRVFLTKLLSSAFFCHWTKVWLEIHANKRITKFIQEIHKEIQKFGPVPFSVFLTLRTVVYFFFIVYCRVLSYKLSCM